MGAADPELVYINDDLNNATLPAVLGCEVIYADDRYPECMPLDDEQISRLQVPDDITQAYPMREIIDQAKFVSNNRGQELKPAWCTMGVQNIAVLVRGSELFADYYGDPELALTVLNAAERLISMSFDYFHATGISMGFICNQNCTVPLSGPMVYQKYLLGYDQALRTKADSLGLGYYIHHCGNFDDYASIYKQVGNVNMFDVGMGSDLRLALNAWPEAKINYFVSHQMIANSCPGDIKAVMRSYVDASGADIKRVSFVLCDIEHGTPDENIRAFVEALAP